MNLSTVASSLLTRSTVANQHGYNSPAFSREHQLQPIVKREVWVAPGAVAGSAPKGVRTEPGLHAATTRPQWAATPKG